MHCGAQRGQFGVEVGPERLVCLGEVQPRPVSLADMGEIEPRSAFPFLRQQLVEILGIGTELNAM